MMNVVLFGPPGSGKGTQSKLLVEKYQFKHTASGDMLRAEVQNKTSLGLEASAFIKHGNLVTDELVIRIIEKNIKNHLDVPGFLFDGFPRTINQAEVLDNLLHGLNFSIQLAIFLDVERQELLSRILQRGKAGGRTDDTNSEIVENRLATYELNTLPLKEYYQKQHKIHILNGINSVETVFGQICEIIDS